MGGSLALEILRKREAKKLDEICATCRFKITIYAGFEPGDNLIGHSWIQVDDVDAKDCKKVGELVRGYWPAGTMDFGDKGRMIMGMPGVVNNDVGEVGSGASHTRRASKSFVITCSQAVAAKKEIERWERGPGTYHGYFNMCATFALAVLRAAGQDIPNANSDIPDPNGNLSNGVPLYYGRDTPVGIYHAITGRSIRDTP
jgi:hypothetical protein